MRRGYNPYYPRRRSGAKWILVLVVVAGLLFYANSKGIIHLDFLNLGNFSFSGNQSSLINSCADKVNACGQIINSKYSISVNVLNKAQMENATDANAFLSTWKGVTQPGDISDYNISSYPIILIATRFDNSDSTKTPYVFICKSDGSFEEKSAEGLC
jgi:hypothetical protein